MKQHPLCTDTESFAMPLDPTLRREWLKLETRRRFLGRAGTVLGAAAVASLLRGGEALAANASPAMRFPNFAPRAKRAIYLFMSGGPPQQDLWDYKPTMEAWYDKDLPESVRGGQQLTGMTAAQSRFPVAPSHFKFTRHGQQGTFVTELLPWTSKIVDELTIVRSLYTDAINHEPAQLLMNTGNMVTGKPSMGAWLSYGLGSLNDNYPTYVVMTSKYPQGVNPQPISAKFWGAGFLPSQHAGVALRSSGDPVLYLSNPAGVDSATRRAMLNGVNKFNELTSKQFGDPETHARVAQYEMAFRMQTSVPGLLDLSDEPGSTWDLYGPDAKEPGTFAYNCLLARRMAERNVRFTQIYHRGWDVHGDVVTLLPRLCSNVDRACYALITDLKQRGLLESTLVICAGEFGRLPLSQKSAKPGRDHNPHAFTTWMAGGGVKGGVHYGSTDEIGHKAVVDKVSINDLHATILHLMGLDHEKLTYKYNGRNFRLTDVAGEVVKKIIA